MLARRMRTLVVIMGLVIATGLGVMLYFASHGPTAARRVFKNVPVEGRFRSTNDTLGHWQLQPVSCLDGSEAGFDGILFHFASGSPVEQISIDASRDGDNVVEVRLADRSGTKYRVHEHECKEITGQVERTHVSLRGHDMMHVKGWIRYDCPEQGLSGQAKVDGCLPETL